MSGESECPLLVATKVEPEDSSDEKSQSADEAPKPKKRYAQHFRSKWLSMPMFKGWLASVPGQSDKAKCKICQSIFKAKRSDLAKHSLSHKHISARDGKIVPQTPAVTNNTAASHLEDGSSAQYSCRRKRSRIATNTGTDVRVKSEVMSMADGAVTTRDNSDSFMSHTDNFLSMVYKQFMLNRGFVDDEIDSFGRFYSSKLKRIRQFDPRQSALLEKIVAEAFYLAELGHLSESCCIAKESPLSGYASDMDMMNGNAN